MLHDVYAKNPGLIKRKIAGELILVPVGSAITDGQKIYSLSSVGEYIFDRLDGKLSLQDILQAILADFSAERGQVMVDIQNFIKDLLAHSLITKIE